MNKIFIDVLKDYVNEVISVEELESFLNLNKEYIHKYFKSLNCTLYRGISVAENSSLLNETSRLKSYSKDKSMASMFSIKYCLGSGSNAYLLNCTKGLCLDVNEFLNDSKYEDEKEVLVFVEEYEIVHNVHIPKPNTLDEALTKEYLDKIKSELVGGLLL